MIPRTRWLAACAGAFGLVLAVAVPGCGVPSRAHSTEHGGEERAWHLYVPPGLPADRAAPLVVVLHGGGGNGRQIERFLAFDALADREGFLVAYPDGLDRGWNDGRGAASVESQRAGVDDAGFLAAMIDEISARHPVDPDRVYVTGISNGGFMSHALANRFPSRIAAIAPVVGGMAPAVAERFGSGAVAVLIVQGTDDPLVPYSGGTVARDRGACIDTVAAAKLWAARNGCPEDWTEAPLPDADPDDGCRVTRRTWAGGGAPVELWTIAGGGHTWPGGSQYLPEAWIGPVCRDFDATEAVWAFFRANPKRR